MFLANEGDTFGDDGNITRTYLPIHYKLGPEVNFFSFYAFLPRHYYPQNQTKSFPICCKKERSPKKGTPRNGKRKVHGVMTTQLTTFTCLGEKSVSTTSLIGWMYWELKIEGRMTSWKT